MTRLTRDERLAITIEINHLQTEINALHAELDRLQAMLDAQPAPADDDAETIRIARLQPRFVTGDETDDDAPTLTFGRPITDADADLYGPPAHTRRGRR